MDHLILGLQAVVTFENLVWLVVGCVLGLVVGVFPGLGAAAAISVLLPFTLGLDPTTAIVMLAAIYYGSMYGGSITAILINTPGDAASVSSTFDGYPLAQQGRAGPALVMQAIAGFVGGTIGVLGLTLLMPPAALVARSLGPTEYVLVVLLGLLTIVVMIGQDKIKGVVSALLGFALGSVGTDLATGAQRFTFGYSDLIIGIDFVPVVIGVFGIGEVLYCIYTGMHRDDAETISVPTGERSFWPTREDFRRTNGSQVRGSVIGFVVGILPGAGAVIASLISYAVEKGVSKRKELFGKGAMEGLVGPEAANNAASSGAMVPMLTLGIPGSSATAVLLGGFLLWGLQPGPLLIAQEPEFAWGLISSMYLGNIVLLALSVFAIPLCARLLRVPYRVLMPVIVVLCIVGTYSVNASMLEVVICLLAGVLGLAMRLYGYSQGALIIALVLAPLFESAARQTYTISDGDPGIFLDRPVARWLLVVIVLVVAGTVVRAVVKKRRRVRRAPSPEPASHDAR